MNNQTIRDVQGKILEIMLFIDRLCRDNDIIYYIMGGTALGAIRHGGFIPWDDDLDIFMTPDNYDKFKRAFYSASKEKFVLQEWRTAPSYLEYAKVRMNGTTFIEEAFKERKDMHHGIYVDIMILHKVPENLLIQKLVYYESKFVTLYALSQRNWKPKSTCQAIILKSLAFMPCKLLTNLFYRHIYKYDEMNGRYKYCYWITPAKFKNGLFDKSFFEEPIDVPFENAMLLGSRKIREYLEYRYGDYMRLPPEEVQKEPVHAMIYNTEKDFSEYFENISAESDRREYE